MSWTPAGVTPRTLEAGQHSVWLTDLKEITDPGKLAKFQAQAVFVATYKDTATAISIDQVIKFNGSKADFYAGQTIDRLYQAAGLPEPEAGETLDLENLKNLLDGVELLLEVNEKGYANAIIVPMGAEETI